MSRFLPRSQQKAERYLTSARSHYSLGNSYVENLGDRGANMTRYVHHQHATCARVSSVLVKIERAFGNESPRTACGASSCVNERRRGKRDASIYHF